MSMSYYALFTLDVCVYVQHCIIGDENANAENGSETILYVSVCIAIDTIRKCKQTLTSIQLSKIMKFCFGHKRE